MNGCIPYTVPSAREIGVMPHDHAKSNPLHSLSSAPNSAVSSRTGDPAAQKIPVHGHGTECATEEKSCSGDRPAFPLSLDNQEPLQSEGPRPIPPQAQRRPHNCIPVRHTASRPAANPSGIDTAAPARWFPWTHFETVAKEARTRRVQASGTCLGKSVNFVKRLNCWSHSRTAKHA